jgi:hypothetical protein
VTEGRRAVYQDFGSGRPDWGTPVIFRRSPDGLLFGPPAAPSLQAMQTGAGITIGGTGANLQGAQIRIGDVAGHDLVKPIAPAQAHEENAGSVQVVNTSHPVQQQPDEGKDMSTLDTFQYDAFISYSHKDKDWVTGQLLPYLEGNGLQVCIDYRDFEVGAPSLVNMENAVKRSRKTLLVLTPNWIASEWTGFELLLIQTKDPAGQARRILPLMVQQCPLPDRLQIFTYLDLTDPADLNIQLPRLIKTIRSEAQSMPAQSALPAVALPAQPVLSTISGSTVVPLDPVQLHKFIDKRFNLEELRDLCFGLQVDYENLGGEGKSGRARELVAHMQRRGRLSELVAAVQRALSED